MRLVVADTSPVNYLVLIESIELLPRMFERVVLPSVVRSELASPDAPSPVRQWVARLPLWIEVLDSQGGEPVAGLHVGEAAAIALAESLPADLLLMDERIGVRVARGRGLKVTGNSGFAGDGRAARSGGFRGGRCAPPQDNISRTRESARSDARTKSPLE